MSLRRWFGLKPTEGDFAKSLLAMAHQAGDAGWTYHPADSALRNGDRTINLANVFREYAQAGAAERPRYLEKYRQLFKPPTAELVPKLWSLAQTRIYPLLRSRHDLVTIAIDSRRSTSRFPPRAAQPFLGDLEVILGYDQGQTITQVTQDNVGAWGVPVEAAIECARDNLRALPAPSWRAIAPRVWKLESAEGYNESFLQLPKAFLQLPAKGAPLAMIPNRGVLLATGFEEQGGINSLLTVATKSMQEAPWPLCGDLFSVGPGGAQPYAPSGGDADLLATIQRIDLATTYGAQKTALDQHHEATQQDLFVATYKLTTTAASPNRASSACTWTESVDTLLPKTDRVVLVRDPRGAKEVIILHWEDVERTVGHYFQATPEDPPRIRVNRFPTPAEWQALLAAKL